MDGLEMILRLCRRHKLLALSRIELRFPGDPLRVVVAAVTDARTPSYCGVLIRYWYLVYSCHSTCCGVMSGRVVIAPLILNLGNRRKWIVCFTFRRLYPHESAEWVFGQGVLGTSKILSTGQYSVSGSASLHCVTVLTELHQLHDISWCVWVCSCVHVGVCVVCVCVCGCVCCVCECVCGVCVWEVWVCGCVWACGCVCVSVCVCVCGVCVWCVCVWCVCMCPCLCVQGVCYHWLVFM